MFCKELAHNAYPPTKGSECNQQMAFKKNCGQQSIKRVNCFFIFKPLKCSFLSSFCFLSYFYYQGVPLLFLFSLVNATSLLYNWFQTHLYTSRIGNTETFHLKMFTFQETCWLPLCGTFFSVFRLNPGISAQHILSALPMSLFLTSFRHTHPP